MADERQERTSNPSQGGTFEGQTIRDHARAHLGNNYSYNTTYTTWESSLFGFFDRRKRNTALLEAAARGYTHRLQAQLRAIANVDYKDTSKWTALQHAACGGFTDCVKILLEAGSDVDAPDADYRTPLFIAIREGRADAASSLISAQGVLVSFEPPSSIIFELVQEWKIENPQGHLGYREYRILQDLDFRCTPVSLAIMYGYLETVQAMYRRTSASTHGILCDNNESLPWTPERCAMWFNRPAILQWLLAEKHTTIDKSNYEALGALPVIWLSRYACLEVLLERTLGRPTVSNDRTEEPTFVDMLFKEFVVGLIFSDRRSDPRASDVIKLLIHHGADVDCIFSPDVMQSYLFGFVEDPRCGVSAIHVASLLDRLMLACILIDNGCDVDRKDASGRTALMYAAAAASLQVAKMLIRAGANIDLRDQLGSSALQYTCGDRSPSAWLKIEDFRQEREDIASFIKDFGNYGYEEAERRGNQRLEERVKW